MTNFVKGLKVKEMISVLQSIEKRGGGDKPFLVACDEEQNVVFKGFYIEHYEDGVLIAGLSGCEEDEE